MARASVQKRAWNKDTRCSVLSRRTTRRATTSEGEKSAHPKSMWKSTPSGSSMRLSRCRSPTPSRYVTTQLPAQLRVKLSRASRFMPRGPPGSALWCRKNSSTLSASTFHKHKRMGYCELCACNVCKYSDQNTSGMREPCQKVVDKMKTDENKNKSRK